MKKITVLIFALLLSNNNLFGMGSSQTRNSSFLDLLTELLELQSMQTFLSSLIIPAEQPLHYPNLNLPRNQDEYLHHVLTLLKLPGAYIGFISDPLNKTIHRAVITDTEFYILDEKELNKNPAPEKKDFRNPDSKLLKPIVYSEKCPLCLDDFNDMQEIAAFHCGHTCCIDCANKALNEKTNCHLCRTEVKSFRTVCFIKKTQ